MGSQARVEVYAIDTNTPHILIVEDNDTDYLLLQRHIKKIWPLSVNGRAAKRSELTTALAQAWDLIITDYHLLDIEGDELLTAIWARHPDTPCLILSGSMDELLKISVPSNVFCRLEKGDYIALSTALTINRHSPKPSG